MSNDGILEQLALLTKDRAVARMQGSYPDFCAAVDATYRANPRQPITPSDDSEAERSLCRSAIELREVGYTRVGQLLDPRKLVVPRAFAQSLPQRAALLRVADAYVKDGELTGLFWPRHPSGFNTRISFAVAAAPPFLRPLVEEIAPIRRIIERAMGYAGTTITERLLIVDNLQPTTAVDFQWWHFDRLYEQYKVMIFLDAVVAGNGPMRVLPGTHKFAGARRMYDYARYVEPAFKAEPGYGEICDRLSDIVHAEGAAGDAFIFDTKLFHAHGRPTEDERRTATVYYDLPNTPINRLLSRYRPDATHAAY